MTKLQDHWEAILASEGMAEISLFDNTGKNKSVTFISTTLGAVTSSKNNHEPMSADSWPEAINIRRFEEPVSPFDLDTSVYWNALVRDVASLPPGWPDQDRALLTLYAETGYFEKARKELAITSAVAYSAKRRFEAWRKNQ